MPDGEIDDEDEAWSRFALEQFFAGYADEDAVYDEREPVMELIINNGKTVICPECYAHNNLEKPVREGQIVLCYACRLRLIIRKVSGKLEPALMSDPLKKEDKSW